MKPSENAPLIKALEQMGHYEGIRELSDGSVSAVGKLMYTTALYCGLNENGWERRFCYPTMEAARGALAKLTSADDEPEAGFIAQRGEIDIQARAKALRPMKFKR